METIIHECEANYGRKAYIKLVGDKVIYDDSMDEYGPIEFNIEILIEALDKHVNATLEETLNKYKNKDNVDSN
jgi:hypothetical protein